MADGWETKSISLNPLAPIAEPLKGALKGLQAVESVLEALLAILKAFCIDFSSPFMAFIKLILAAIRAIINQIKATGFSMMWVLPDYGRQDPYAVFESVSGSFRGFENKIIGKFHDTADLFRPQYPAGSTAVMLALYVEASTPEGLLPLIFDMQRLIKTWDQGFVIGTPQNLKVSPVKKGGSAISKFRNLFDSDLDSALQLEWQLPNSVKNSNPIGFMNKVANLSKDLGSLIKISDFVIERSLSPSGNIVKFPINSQTVGSFNQSVAERFNLAKPDNNAIVTEHDGSEYRDFEKKIYVKGADLIEGALTGTYRYLDNDPTLVPGKTYYYRVRPVSGNRPFLWLDVTKPEQLKENGLVKQYQNEYEIYFGEGVHLGKPSPVSRGIVPRTITGSSILNVYDGVYEAVQAAILLNFDLPAYSSDKAGVEKDMRTGWGTLSSMSYDFAFKGWFGSKKKLLAANIPFKTTVRRLSNSIGSNLYQKPAVLDIISQKYNAGIKEIVAKVLQDHTDWKFINTEYTEEKIKEYVRMDDRDYNKDYYESDTYNGPCPLSIVSVEERKALAEFIQLCFGTLNKSSSYLKWHGATIGDIFPNFTFFIFDFEQFILSLIGALKSAVAELEAIIQTLIDKIKALESVLNQIIDFIEYFNFSLTASYVIVNSTSSDGLLSEFVNSSNKPPTNRFGLHSGLVLAAGGPGEASVAAIKAITFLLSM